MNSRKRNLFLRNANLSILVLGQIISLFGSAIQRFAFSLYVLDITGSGSVFASILAFSMIPIVILAPVAGVIADRLNRKNVMVVLDFISAGLIFAYAVFLARGTDSVMMVGIVSFLLSGISTIYQPTVTSSIPDIVEEDELMAANGMVQQVSSLSNLLGPILAGIFYGFLGIKGIVLINAVSFCFSAIMELFLKMPKKHIISEGNIFRIFVGDIKESNAYLRNENRIIFRMIFTSGLYNLFLVPIFSVGAPYIIKITLGMSDQTYGFAEGVIALGMIVGAMIVSMWPKRFSIRTVYRVLYVSVVCMFMMGAVLLLPKEAIASRFMIAIGFTLFGSGIMLVLGIANVITASFMQTSVPSHMLGKISAYGLAFATVCVPLGQLLFGAFLDVMSDKVSLLVILFSIFTFGVTLIVRWNVRQIKETI